MGRIRRVGELWRASRLLPGNYFRGRWQHNNFDKSFQERLPLPQVASDSQVRYSHFLIHLFYQRIIPWLPFITLSSAADIKDLKIIESRTEPLEQTHSTVAVTKSNKKVQRATVCETLQANPTSSGE